LSRAASFSGVVFNTVPSILLLRVASVSRINFHLDLIAITPIHELKSSEQIAELIFGTIKNRATSIWERRISLSVVVFGSTKSV
jgi:hypothetical protein